MARSNYIYTIFYDEEVVSAFTVKHEMLECLPEQYDDFLKKKIKIIRFRDNDGAGAYTKNITNEILLEEYI